MLNLSESCCDGCGERLLVDGSIGSGDGFSLTQIVKFNGETGQSVTVAVFHTACSPDDGDSCDVLSTFAAIEATCCVAHFVAIFGAAK